MADDYETGKNDTNNEGVFFGGCDDTIRSCVTSSRPAQDRAGYNTPKNDFGSTHAGAFGMCMCDGSVQRITYSIDSTVHARLSDRATSEVAQIPQ